MLKYIKKRLQFSCRATAFACLFAIAPTFATGQIPYPKEAVCQPSFFLSNGHNFYAGKGSVVRLPNSRQTYLITVMHVFGPDGGLDQVIPADQLPATVNRASLLDPQTGEETGHTGPELLRSGEGNPPDHDASKDLVAFEMEPGYSRHVFSIADRPASVGSSCHLLTYLDDNAPADFAGVVIQSGPKLMIFKPKNGVRTHATSGSPIINDAGEIIGILLGHDTDGNIWCNPGFSIKRRLLTEISPH